MTRGEARPHALEQGRDPKDNHLQGNEAPQLPVGEPEFGTHNHHVDDLLRVKRSLPMVF